MFAHIFSIQARSTSSTSYFDIDPERLLKVNSKENETDNIPKPILPGTDEGMEHFRMEQYRRMQERREQAKAKMKEMIENPNNYVSETTELMNEEQIDSLREEVLKTDPNLEEEEHRWLRNNNNNNNRNKYVNNNNMYYSENYNKNNYNNNNRNGNKRTKYNNKNNYNPYDINDLADPSQYFSEWSQAYRMLGSYISCDHGGVGYYGGQDMRGCSRWILWASVSKENC